MLDIKPLDVTKYVADGEADLHFESEADSYVQGAVAEDTAHATLLFGLMENANDWKKEIGIALEGWDIRTVQVDEVGFFESDQTDYYTIIAHLKPSDALAEGNARLRLLPHIDTFPSYRPHVTLAYIKKDVAARKTWITALGDHFNGKRLTIDPEINYGGKNSLRVGPEQSRVQSQLAASDVSQLSSQEASLHNTIEQVEEQLALAVINKVDKNVYDETSEVIAERDRKEQERQLTTALLVFYSLVVPLQAQSVMQRRSQQYGKPGTFAVDAAVRQAIDEASTRAADSHVETILEDLRQTVKQTMIAEGDISRIAAAVAKKYPDVTAEQLKASVREAAKGGKSDSEIAQALRAKYKGADFEDLLAGIREAALKGAEHDQLLKAIRQEYTHISQTLCA